MKKFGNSFYRFPIPRWFYKYEEVKRFLILRESVEAWFRDYSTPDTLLELDEADWDALLVSCHTNEIDKMTIKLFGHGH